MPTKRSGISLGQSDAIDRIVYKSMSGVNPNARGQSAAPTVRVGLVVEEYVDFDDEGHPS